VPRFRRQDRRVRVAGRPVLPRRQLQRQRRKRLRRGRTGDAFAADLRPQALRLAAAVVEQDIAIVKQSGDAECNRSRVG
jgi:hypothetical protein